MFAIKSHNPVTKKLQNYKFILYKTVIYLRKSHQHSKKKRHDQHVNFCDKMSQSIEESHITL